MLDGHKTKVLKSIDLNEEHMAFAKSYGPKSKTAEVRCNNEYPKAISMELRQDLVDTEIAICTQEVLHHFADNFDKSSLKDGFINWMYESEIIEDRVRAFEVQQQGAYMGRIHDPRLYGIVSKDVLQRKAYPLVIDKKAIDSNSNYEYQMISRYIEESAQIAISSHVSNVSVIGSNSIIDHNCKIIQSVIGENCQIGNNVTIENCIIDRNVRIEGDCHIVNSIIQSGVRIKANCTIESGSLVASSVIVNEGTNMPSGSICSMYIYDRDEKDFIDLPKAKYQTEFFEKGAYNILPYELKIKESGLLGKGIPNTNDEESDLVSDEEDSIDPQEDFERQWVELFE